MFQQDPLLLGVVMRRAMKKKKQRQVETCRAPGDFRFCRTQHATGYTADTLSDSHTVSHSCVLLMDTSACLYQSFWDDCPSGCSGSVTPESKKKTTLSLLCSVSFLYFNVAYLTAFRDNKVWWCWMCRHRHAHAANSSDRDWTMLTGHWSKEQFWLKIFLSPHAKFPVLYTVLTKTVRLPFMPSRSLTESVH